MYQVQVQNHDGQWVATGTPTPSYMTARNEAAELRELLDAEVRVACVDNAVQP